MVLTVARLSSRNAAQMLIVRHVAQWQRSFEPRIHLAMLQKWTVGRRYPSNRFKAFGALGSMIHASVDDAQSWLKQRGMVESEHNSAWYFLAVAELHQFTDRSL